MGSTGTNLIANTFPNQAVLASPENPVNGQTTNTLANLNLRGAERRLGGEWHPRDAGRLLVQLPRLPGVDEPPLSARVQSADVVTVQSFARQHQRGERRPEPAARWIYGDYYNREGNWGPSSFDRPHRLVVSYLWDLPALRRAGPIVEALLSNWSLSGVTTVQTGLAFSVTDSRGGTIVGASSYAQFATGRGPADAEKSGPAQDG